MKIFFNRGTLIADARNWRSSAVIAAMLGDDRFLFYRDDVKYDKKIPSPAGKGIKSVRGFVY